VKELLEQYERFPEHIKAAIDRIKRSEHALADTGVAINISNNEEELDCNVNEDNEWSAINNGHDDARCYDKPDEIIENVRDPNTEPLISSNISRGNVSKDEIEYYHNWISNTKQRHNNICEHTNRLSIEESVQQREFGTKYSIPKSDEREEQLHKYESQLNERQLRVYNTYVEHLNNPNASQLIMFVSGEGGTGKSRLIECIKLYTRLTIGRTSGSWGSIVIMAPTGSSASNIGGNTWQSHISASGSNQWKLSDPLGADTQKYLLSKGDGCKLERKVHGDLQEAISPAC
jgi:hypothetical protein